MPDRAHEELPREDAHHDRRQPVEHVGQEARDVGEAGAAVLGQIQSRADADRQADQAAEADEHERADDRVGHAAARLADRLRHVREEMPLQ